MIIFGGLGTVFGPIIGAFAYLGLERYLAELTIHWPIIFGPILIAVVFLGRSGLFTLFMPAGDTANEKSWRQRWLKSSFRQKN